MKHIIGLFLVLFSFTLSAQVEVGGDGALHSKVSQPVALTNEVKGSVKNVADTTARNAIATNLREIGMRVYVASTQKDYQLQGGILNANWVDVSTGIGSANFTYSSTAPSDTNIVWRDIGARSDMIYIQKSYINGLWVLTGYFDAISKEFSALPPIYILSSGQSNAVNNLCTPATAADTVVNNKVVVFNTANSKWEIARAYNIHDPAQNGYTAQNTIAWTAAKKIAEEGRIVRLVVSALGGQFMSKWTIDSTQYNKILTYTSAANITKPYDIVIWNQGEADSETGGITNWFTQFDNLFLTNLPAANIVDKNTKFLIGQIKFDPSGLSEELTKQIDNNTKYNQFVVVSNQGLTSCDAAHYDNASLLEYGFRTYRALQNVPKRTVYSVNQIDLTAINGVRLIGGVPVATISNSAKSLNKGVGLVYRVPVESNGKGYEWDASAWVSTPSSTGSGEVYNILRYITRNSLLNWDTVFTLKSTYINPKFLLLGDNDINTYIASKLQRIQVTSTNGSATTPMAFYGGNGRLLYSNLQSAIDGTFSVGLSVPGLDGTATDTFYVGNNNTISGWQRAIGILRSGKISFGGAPYTEAYNFNGNTRTVGNIISTGYLQVGVGTGLYVGSLQMLNYDGSATYQSIGSTLYMSGSGGLKFLYKNDGSAGINVTGLADLTHRFVIRGAGANPLKVTDLPAGVTADSLVVAGNATNGEIRTRHTPTVFNEYIKGGTTATFASIATGANGTAVSVTFPTAFASTPAAITLAPNVQVFCWVTTKSASGFSCNCRNDSGGALTPAVDWIARQ